MLVPQGMAYGELAGVAPVAGLYTAICALVGYALFLKVVSIIVFILFFEESNVLLLAYSFGREITSSEHTIFPDFVLTGIWVTQVA